MGLAGRDPVFFAQLSSETQTFHPASSSAVQDTCLGCHGILGQRQFGIDMPLSATGKCQPFARDTVDATPFPPNDPVAKLAHYGGLARDGISCAACHHMVLGNKDSGPVANLPQNVCVGERQADLNPGFSGFGKTITGSFFVGATDRFYGPFDDPKTKPMNHALGVDPEHNANIKTSEVCGTCHTVHLPIYYGTQTIGRVYEQSNYPEWAFSAYRTGTSPDGPLPARPRLISLARRSCQDCHIAEQRYRQRNPAIQEARSRAIRSAPIPRSRQHACGHRPSTCRHATAFAQPHLGRPERVLAGNGAAVPRPAPASACYDPMLVDQTGSSIRYRRREAAMVNQALTKTVALTVSDVKNDGQALGAKVTPCGQPCRPQISRPASVSTPRLRAIRGARQ